MEIASLGWMKETLEGGQSGVDDGQTLERRTREVFRLTTEFCLGKQRDRWLGTLWTTTEKRREAEHRGRAIAGGPTRSTGARGIRGASRGLDMSALRRGLWMERKI